MGRYTTDHLTPGLFLLVTTAFLTSNLIGHFIVRSHGSLLTPLTSQRYTCSLHSHSRSLPCGNIEIYVFILKMHSVGTIDIDVVTGNTHLSTHQGSCMFLCSF